VLLTKEPFFLSSPFSLSSDNRTRITVVALNVPVASDTLTQLSAFAISSQDVVYTLPIEYVGTVEGFPWFTRMTLRLPDDATLRGDIAVTVWFRGSRSNLARVAIGGP
jgi:hypothetical protein